MALAAQLACDTRALEGKPIRFHHKVGTEGGRINWLRRSGNSFQIGFQFDTGSRIGRELEKRVRSKQLKGLSIGHDMFSREAYEVSVCETGSRPGTVIVNAAATTLDEAHLARVARVRRMLRMCSLYGSSVQVHAANPAPHGSSAMNSQPSPDVQKVWVPPTQADRQEAARILAMLQGLASNGQVGIPPIDPRSTSITDPESSRAVLAQMAREAAAQVMPNYQVQSNLPAPTPAFLQQQASAFQPNPLQQQPSAAQSPSAEALKADQAARFMQRLNTDPEFARQMEQLMDGKTTGGPSVAVSPAFQQGQPPASDPNMLAMLTRLQTQLDEAKAEAKAKDERAEFDKLWESVQVGGEVGWALLLWSFLVFNLFFAFQPV
jgi:hypothetical protein